MPPPATGIIVLNRTLKVKEKLNMMVKSKDYSLHLGLARLVYLTYARLKICLDEILEKQGLTTEQYTVLVTVKYREAPVRITDIARWTERSTNSVTMIVDRMVKAGLVRRVRDRNDRRVVKVVITSKAESALKPANIAAMEFFRQVMSPLSHEDAQTFTGMFKMINYKMLERLNPGADIEAMLKNDSKHSAYLYKQLK
jgi:DNA-binding MarR family transcriptional regulator